jgi:hypothetical protein
VTIDVYFDHRQDSNGKDPDIYSPTLKSQHKLLWSKPLPDGTVFYLEDEPGRYLSHKSALATFHLSSDTISHSLRNQKKMQHVISQIPSSRLDDFQSTGSVIGAKVIFPGNSISNLATINVSRGFNQKINDRFDLSLECIRLHYLGLSNPLNSVLSRYSNFFRLFRDFQGYVEFFLFQDLVSNDSSSIRFLLPHDPSFAFSPLPNSVDAYAEYMNNSVEFIQSRNSRIEDWANKNL